ncbi:hypothetical protein V8B55DRAFT_1580449 [Mucor lusitanicus]|uniref:Uncharacterized protein n=1 Tax=Mucor lusitanicus CBS 277.49 TaxID=747725 RepID=A0A162Y618_MUCCL|nr:hypothetical protein MUCCIDRAFT_116317 [Mucor lusitanicus CBS 277.49]
MAPAASPITGRHGNTSSSSIRPSSGSNRSSPANHYRAISHYYAMSDSGSEGEEEIQTAMHDLGLQDHPSFARRYPGSWPAWFMDYTDHHPLQATTMIST